MKKMNHITKSGILLIASALLLNSCIGSFSLTRNLIDWNRNLDGKYANEIVFIALNIIPVYGVTVLTDALVLNSIEFWSGRNPITMTQGTKSVTYISGKEGNFKMEVTRNRVRVQSLSNPSETADIQFNTEQENVTLNHQGAEVPIMKLHDGNKVSLLLPDGSSKEIALNPTE